MNPLRNIKVLEMEGLAPTVFAGRMLADLGATVTIVSRPEKIPISLDIHESTLNHGKRSIIIDLKNKIDVECLKVLIKDCDVIIDAYKPGVMEKVGLGPDDCFKINEKIVYTRITSYGQSSQLSQTAGHDINFLSYSGVLSMLASTGGNHLEQPPAIPGNLVGDFAAGSCLAVVGILAALMEVQRGGRGQVVDLGMAQASIYLSQFIINSKIHGVWNQLRGNNLLDGGAHFYYVYKCQDGKYISLGCIETKFYQNFINVLRSNGVDQSFCADLEDNHLNSDKWLEFKLKLEQIFLQKSRDEWNNVFEGTESCFSPVYDVNEVKKLGNQFLGSKNRPLLIDLDKNNVHSFDVTPQPILSNVVIDQSCRQAPTRGQHNNLKPKL